MEWDFDMWHHPEMGVELEFDDGARYSSLWGDAFGHFNIELAAEPLAAWFPQFEELMEHFRVWDVTDHPLWAALIAGAIVDAELVWAEGWGEEVPVSVRLAFPGGAAWIAAARPQDFPPTGSFYCASDEVIVVFDEALAREIGVADSNPRRKRWFAHRSPCPQCGHRLEAVYAVIEREAFLECPDCGLGFADPNAFEDPAAQVFRRRELVGERRPATPAEIDAAGWSMVDFA